MVATFWVTAPPAMTVRSVARRSSVQSELRSNLVEAQTSTPSAQPSKEGLRQASCEKQWAEYALSKKLRAAASVPLVKSHWSPRDPTAVDMPPTMPDREKACLAAAMGPARVSEERAQR